VRKMHYLILGNCAAGLNGIEGIRSLDKKGEITLISAESYPAYARCLITNFLIGTHSEEDLYLREKDFYQKNGVKVLPGKKAVRIFPKEKKVETEEGKKIPYDALLIATGASPKALMVKGEEKKGVFGFRTLEDAKQILKRAEKAEKALVFGGGLIGLKAGYALKKKGLAVEVIVKSPRVLSRVVEENSSRLIAKWLQEKGIKIRTGLAAREILGDKEMSGVLLDNGEEVKAQIAIVGKGVSPNLSFTEGSGINTHWGIVADNYLRTNFQEIFVAGDVAETKDLVTGERTINALWLAAQEQGKTAGINMAGGEKAYPGSIGANAAEFFGLPFISMGCLQARNGEIIRERKEEKKFIYRRLVFKEGRLIGAVLVGKVEAAGIYMALIRKKERVENLMDELLEGWIDYGKFEKILEGENGFRETVTPDGRLIKLP